MSIFDDQLIAGTITKPWYVLEIRLGYETIRVSTGDPADWDGVAFESGIIAEGLFSVDDQGLRVGIMNSNYERSGPALRGEYHGGMVRAWSAPESPRPFTYLPIGYVAQGYEEGTLDVVPRLVFEGAISDVLRVDQVIEIQASRRRLGGYPRIRVNTPLANFTALPGTTVSVSGKIYTVHQRGGDRG